MEPKKTSDVSNTSTIRASDSFLSARPSNTYKMVANVKGTMTWPYRIGLPEARAKELAAKCIGYIQGYTDAKHQQIEAGFLAAAKRDVLKDFPELAISPELQMRGMRVSRPTKQRYLADLFIIRLSRKASNASLRCPGRPRRY